MFSNFTAYSSPDNFDQLLVLGKVEELYEPPLTMSVHDEDLEFFVVPDEYPAHNQTAERFIKLVTSTSS